MLRRLFDDDKTTVTAAPASAPADDGRAATATLPAGEPPLPAPAPLVVAAPGSARSTRRPGRWRAWLPDLAAVALLCALAVALTWPLARHPGSTVPDLGDPLDSAWRLTWPVHQLLHDPRHLLDANIFYPVRTTYLFDELILGVALIVAPVTLLTGNGILAFNVALLLAFAGNGVAMYLLARRLTRSRWAALAGAVVYAAAPFRYQHLGHIGLSTAYWTPLALLFLDRLLLRPRWRDALAFGACVAMQALSAQYYGYQIAIVAALYLLYALVYRRAYLFDGQFILRLIVATIFAEALLLPVVAPYTAVKGTWGYTRGLAENELYSATLSSYLAAPAYLLGGRVAGALRAALGVRDWSVWLYPGLGAALVALLGLVRPRQARPDGPGGDEPGWPVHDLYPFMVGLALVGAALTLGPVLYPTVIRLDPLTRAMPYRLLFNVVPGFDAMRAPERFGNVVLLGLAGAVSFGVAGVLERLGGWGRRARRRSLRARLAWLPRALVALLLLAAVGAEYAHAPLHLRTVPPTPAVDTWLAAQPPGVTIELPLGAPSYALNREQLRQYYSTANWQPRINGSSDITPLADDALRLDLTRFPDPRTLGILQGLGVRYVVVHRAEYAPYEQDWLTARLNLYPTTLRLRARFGDDYAYELQPDARFAALARAIPPGADVFLSSGDPAGSDAYMAMLGYLLRDHRLLTVIVPTFGQRYTRPEPGMLAQYAVLYNGEDPARYNYPAGMQVVYEDNVVRVYRR
ncbi:MAG TPA: hypothetical protein VFW96_25560 [Thermomicrobiales bacterium]|nr:hypothetical protein [Thermomicrobiales bacterium]